MKILTLALLALSAYTCCAAPPAPSRLGGIDALVADYLARKPTDAVSNIVSLADALVFQKAFVERLSSNLGQRVGYKAGLVSKEAQKVMGVDSPVRGVLLSKMLLPNRAEVSPDFGVRPLCEADLIVVVKDSAIHKARTHLDLARHLKEIVAFIELPDAFLASNVPPSAAILTAMNVGARLGVLGERFPIKATPEFVEAMARMKVVLTDQHGKELGQAQGNLLLDHPLNVVQWLVQDLANSGEKLKRGDLLSLGSLKVVPIRSGQTVTAHYEGLPGGPIQASVRFK